MINLGQSEKIVSMYRRHWIALLAIVFRVTFNIALIFGLRYGLNFILSNEIISEFNLQIQIFFYLLIEFALLGLFLNLTDYYLDLWIVTNEKMIFIELKGLFRRTVSSVNLKSIEDITTNMNGVIQTFLDYGTIKVESAGTDGEFFFKQISHPNEVKDLILKTKAACKQQ